MGYLIVHNAHFPYGVSKIETEKVIENYRNAGLACVIVRPCMIYGEREPHAFNRIMRLVKLRLVPIVNVGLWESKLQLGYIENLVDLLMLCKNEDKATVGTFIAADDDVITIRKFIEILYDEYSESKPPMVHPIIYQIFSHIPFAGSFLKKKFKDRTYDISRAVTKLGYKPRVSTEEALRSTVRSWKRTNCN